MTKVAIQKIHAHRGLTSPKMALQAHLNNLSGTLTALDFLLIIIVTTQVPIVQINAIYRHG
jgi:hypothetical protein